MEFYSFNIFVFEEGVKPFQHFLAAVGNIQIMMQSIYKSHNCIDWDEIITDYVVVIQAIILMYKNLNILMGQRLPPPLRTFPSVTAVILTISEFL